MRLVRASLLKLVHRPATMRTFLLLVGLLALIYVALGLSARAAASASSQSTIAGMLTFPDALRQLASMLLIFGGFAGAAHAGMMAGSEWTWSTFRAALTRGESRVHYLIGLFLAIGLVALIAWVVLCLLGVGLIVVAAGLGGLPASDPLAASTGGQLVLVVASGGWAVLMEVAIGFAAAFIARSQVAGVATIAGLFFVERFAELVLPADALRFAPITAATNLVADVGKTGLEAGLGLAFVVTSLYLVGAITLGALAARRAQVT
ncbi:MAG: hypothetical protein ACHQZR_05550 [Candidatus Limnocylindrales bacterium]